MVCPCRLSTSPPRVPRPRLLAWSTPSIPCRLSAWTYSLAASLPNLHNTQRCPQMSAATRRPTATQGRPRKDFLLVPLLNHRVEPVTSPRSCLMSDYGDPDKNVTFRVIDKKSTHIVEELILVGLKCTLYRTRFVLLFHLPTIQFTPSPDGVTSINWPSCQNKKEYIYVYKLPHLYIFRYIK